MQNWEDSEGRPASTEHRFGAVTVILEHLEATLGTVGGNVFLHDCDVTMALRDLA